MGCAFLLRCVVVSCAVTSFHVFVRGAQKASLRRPSLQVCVCVYVWCVWV